MKEFYTVSLIIGVFVFFWIGMSYFLARFSGWVMLAQTFPERQGVEQKRYRFRSIRIGWSRYNNCTMLSIGHEGLRIAMSPPFLFGHHPILLPWKEIQYVKKELFMTTRLRVRLSPENSTEMTVPSSVIDDAMALGYLSIKQ